MIPRKCIGIFVKLSTRIRLFQLGSIKGTTNIWGKYRKEMTDNFDFVRYRNRFLVETKFSVLKRRFGADLKSRIFPINKKDLM